MVLTITKWAIVKKIRTLAGFRRWCELRGNLDKSRLSVANWDELYRTYRNTPIA